MSSIATNDTKLDKKLKALLGKGPDAYTAEQWNGFREQMRLPLLYPGKYVLFRDHYAGNGAGLRLIRREVLRSGRSLLAVNRWLDQQPAEIQRGIHILYVDPTPVN